MALHWATGNMTDLLLFFECSESSLIVAQWSAITSGSAEYHYQWLSEVLEPQWYQNEYQWFSEVPEPQWSTTGLVK